MAADFFPAYSKFFRLTIAISNLDVRFADFANKAYKGKLYKVKIIKI